MLGQAYSLIEDQLISGSIAFGAAVEAVFALAAQESQDALIEVGLKIGDLVTETPGGESSGPNRSAAMLEGLFTTAAAQGTLTNGQIYAILAGLAGNQQTRVFTPAIQTFSALISGSGTEAAAAVRAVIAAYSIVPQSEIGQLAPVIKSVAQNGSLDFGDVISVFHAGILNDTATVVSGLDIAARAAASFDTLAAASALATEIVGLVAANKVTVDAALDAMVAGAKTAWEYYGGVTTASPGAAQATRMLLAVAAEDGSLAIAAAARIAAMVDVVSPPNYGPYYGLLYASAAISAITAKGFPLDQTVSMLAVLAGSVASPNAQGQSRDPLHLVGNLLHSLVESGSMTGVAAIAAVGVAIGALGLPENDAIRLLVGLGATGHTVGFAYLSDPDLMAASAAAVAALIHADTVSAQPDLTSSGIEDAVAAAIASTRGMMGGLHAVQLMVAAVGQLPAGDLASALLIGQVLRGYGASDIRTVINTGLPTGDAAVAMLAGMGTGGGAASVEAGRLLETVLDVRAAVLPVNVVAAIVGYANNGPLTADQAILVLSGLATAANQRGQAAAWQGLATLLSTDTQARLAALDQMIGLGKPLTGDQAVALLTNVATLASGTVSSAIMDEIVVIVLREGATMPGHSIDILLTAVETAGQYLYGAEKIAAQASVAQQVGAQIVTMVANGTITADEAMQAVDAAVLANPPGLSPLRALAALANMQATGLDAAKVQAEVAALIAHGSIGVRDTVQAFVVLQVAAAPAALQTALAANVEAILYAPANFAVTAGLGTNAEIAHVAGLVAALFGTDAAAAQAVLDGLSGRLAAGGDLTAEQAATLLVDIYAGGGAAAVAAQSTILALTMVQAGQNAPAIAASLVSGKLPGAFGQGLDAAAAFALLEALLPRDANAVQQAFAALVRDGHVASSDLVGEVDAGRLPAASALRALSDVIGSATANIRAEAATAMHGLNATIAGDAQLAAAVLPIFVTLAGRLDADVRAAGYDGIEAVAQVAGLGLQAFSALFGYVGDQDAGVRNDARSALAALVASQALTTGEAVNALKAELSLSNPSPVLHPGQVLTVLSALSTIGASHDDVMLAMVQIVAENKARANSGLPPYGFSGPEAIRALAENLTGNMGSVAVTAADIVRIASDGGVSIATIAAQTGTLAIGDRVTLLAQIGGLLTGAGDAFAMGRSIAAQISSLSSADKLAAFSGMAALIQDDVAHLRPQKAAEMLLGVYAGGQAGTFAAEIQALVAAGKLTTNVVFSVTAAIAAGVVDADTGVGALVVLYGSGPADLGSTAALAIANAITGRDFAGTPIAPAGAMAVIEAAVVSETLNIAHGFALVEGILLARLGQSQTGPAEEQATAALKVAVTAQLAAFIADGRLTLGEAITLLAHIAGGVTDTQRYGIGGQIVSLVQGTVLTDAAVVADVVAATQGGGAITDLQAARVLVALAASGDAGLQVEAGKAIAAFFSAGSITSIQVFQTVYGPITDHWLTAAQELSLVLGLVAGGAAPAAAPILHQMIGNFFTFEDLATALAGALADGTVTGAQAVDTAAEMGIQTGSSSEAAALLEAVIATARITPADAVVQFGQAIGTGLMTSDVAIATIATVIADLDAAGQRSAGFGLAGLLVAGDLTEAELSAGLLLAVNGASVPPVPAILSVDAAMAMLTGMASADAAAAALLVADLLVGQDGRFAGFATALEATIDASGLTAGEAVQFLIGVAAASGDAVRAAAAGELGHLVELGLIGVTTANGLAILAGEIQNAIRGHSLEPVAGLFMLIRLHANGQTVDNLDGRVAGLIESGDLDAAAAVSRIMQDVTANPPALATAQATALLSNIAYYGLLVNDAALVGSVATGLANFLRDGTITVTDLVGGALAPGQVATVAAIIHAGVSAAIETSLIDGILANSMFSNTLAGISLAVDHQVFSGADALALFMKLAEGGDGAVRKAVSAEIASFLLHAAVTPAEVVAALNATGVSREAAVVVATGLVDVNNAASVSILHDVMDPVLPGLAGDFRQIMLGALSADGSSTNGLTAVQAVLALADFPRHHQTDPVAQQILGPTAAVGIVSLIETGRIQVAQVFALLQGEILRSTGSERLAEGALLAAVGLRLGYTDYAVAQLIATNAGANPSANAVEALAALSGSDISAAAIGKAIVQLIDRGLDANTAFTALASATTASTAATVEMLKAAAHFGTGAVAVSAGRHAASFGDTAFTSTTSWSPEDAQIAYFAGLAAAGGVAFGERLGVFIAGRGVDILNFVQSGMDVVVRSGAMTTREVMGFLAEISYGSLSTGNSFSYRLTRSVVDTTVKAIASGLLPPADMAKGFALGTAGGSAALVSETGGRLAAFTASGLLTATDAVQAIAGSGTTDAQILKLLAAAAASNLDPAWIVPAAAWIGARLEAGSFAVAATISAMTAASAAYADWDVSATTRLLVAVAHHNVTGLAMAVGRTAGELGAPDLPAIIETAASTGLLTSAEIRDLVIGAAATIGVAARLELAYTFNALSVAGLTSDVTVAVRDAITAAEMTPATAVAFLTELSVANTGNAAHAALEIATAVSAGHITAAGSLGVILDVVPTVSAHDNPTLGKGTGDLLAGLVEAGTLTLAAVIEAIDAAAVFDHRFPLTIAAGMLPSLAASAGNTALLAVAAEFLALIAGGLAPAMAAEAMKSAVTAGTLTADEAVTLAAATASSAASGGIDVFLQQVFTSAISDLVTAGHIPVAAALDDIVTASRDTVVGALSAADLIARIGGMREADFAAVGVALNHLLDLGGIGRSGIFATVEALLQADGGGLDRPLALSLIAFGAQGTTATRIATGQELGSLVARQILPAAKLLDALDPAVATGIDNAAIAGLALAAAGASAKSMQIMLGQFLADKLGAFTLSQFTAAMDTALSDGSLDAAALTGVLAGFVSLDGYSALAMPVAVAELQMLVGTGTLTVADIIADLDLALAAAPSLDAILRLLVIEFGAAGAVATRIAVGESLMGRIDQHVTTLDTVLSDLGAALSRGVAVQAVDGLALAIAAPASAAQKLAIGAFIGGRLAGIADQAAGDAAITASTAGMDAAISAGVITAAELVVVLAGIAGREGSNAHAVKAATAEFVSLVGNGAITATDAMVSVQTAAGAGAPIRSLVHWLAAISATATLRDDAALLIDDFVASGRLTVNQATDFIVELANTTPAGIAPGLAIGGDLATQLLVDVAEHGTAAMQDRVGTSLALLATDANRAFITANIDAELASGALGASGALHVASHFLADLSGDTLHSVAGWAADRLGAYLTTAGVAPADIAAVLVSAAAHGSRDSNFELGALAGRLGAASFAAVAAHDANAANGLTDERAVWLFIGMSANQTASGAVFLSAAMQMFDLVDHGLVSGALVYNEARASGLMTAEQIAYIRQHLAIQPDDATLIAITADRVATMRHIGPATDAFFVNGLPQAALDFERIVQGTLTVDQAIARVEAYAHTHRGSIEASLSGLQNLLSDAGRNADAAVVGAELNTRHFNGDFAWDLAKYLTSTSQNIGVPMAKYLLSQEADGSYQRQLLDMDLRLAGPMQSADAVHAVAGTLANFGYGSLLAYEPLFAVLREKSYWPAEVVAVVRDTLVSELQTSFQRNLAGEIGARRISDIHDIAGRLDEVISLASDGMGAAYEAGLRTLAEKSFVANVFNGSIEQRLMAGGALADIDMLTKMFDTFIGETSGPEFELTRQMGLAWMYVNAFKSAADYKSQLIMSALRGGQYVEDVVVGMGALLSLPIGGAVGILGSERTKIANAAANVIETGLVPFYHTSFQALVTAANAVQNTADAAARLVLQTADDFSKTTAYTLLATGWDKLQGSRNVLGVLHDDIATDPQSLTSYTRFAGGIVAGSVTAAVAESMLGVPGLALTAISLGSKAAIYGLAQGAVYNALGKEATSALTGTFMITGATAGLLGNTVFDVVQTRVDDINTAGQHLFELGDAIKNGDLGAIASGTLELGLDYFKLLTGYDPQLVGKVAEDFGRLMVDLFSGNFGDLKADVIALGTHFLDIFSQNMAFRAIGENMVRYAGQINDALSFLDEPFRLLGGDIASGFLKIGSGLDQFGNAVRDVGRMIGGGIISFANDVGDAVSDFVGGLFDGYISGATVFVDANFNGILDPGESRSITDVNGHYSLTGTNRPIVAYGGYDTATNLPFTGKLTAPAGSSVVSPLTTLLQALASSGNGDAIAAMAKVNAALGLPQNLNLATYDAIEATKVGLHEGGAAYAASVSLQNTVALLKAAGATTDPYAALAAAIAAAHGGPLDLINTATMAAIATASGLSGARLDAAVQVITQSNALVDHIVQTTTDPSSLLVKVTAAAIAAQGDTVTALTHAGGDAAALADLVTRYTGAALETVVTERIVDVGTFGGQPSSGGGWGDVHYYTLDGLRYDLQSTGDYVITRTTSGPALEVQGRAEGENGLSWLTAVTTATGGHHVSVDAAREGTIEIDGTLKVLAVGDQFRFDALVVQRTAANTHRIITATNDVIQVIDQGSYLDVEVTPGAHRAAGSFEGLLGNFDGNASNDFALRDGMPLGTPGVQTIEGIYADAWRTQVSDTALLAWLDNATVEERAAWLAEHGGAGSLQPSGAAAAQGWHIV